MYCQSTKNTEGVTFNSGLSGCSLYCQSTFLDALKSHINRCCQLSPNMLSKHQQFCGSLLMYCQSTNNSEGVTLILAARCSPNVLSKYQRSGGVTCRESPNVLSKYQQSSWGSCTCFLSNLLVLLPVFYHTSIFIQDCISAEDL